MHGSLEIEGQLKRENSLIISGEILGLDTRPTRRMSISPSYAILRGESAVDVDDAACTRINQYGLVVYLDVAVLVVWNTVYFHALRNGGADRQISAQLHRIDRIVVDIGPYFLWRGDCDYIATALIDGTQQFVARIGLNALDAAGLDRIGLFIGDGGDA